MTQTKTWGWALLCLLLICLPVFAQESAVKGNISGVIQDSTGAVVPGAKVTLTGPQGERALTSESDGKFTFSLLTPGMYSVKVEKQGFRATEVKNVEVAIGRTTSVSLKLEPGAVSEVIEVTGAATTVDTTTTAVGANLADTFYQQVPVARNVASLFYVAPGAADSGGAGHSNPSISGASGLENLYMADGVNITDSAFGGLGVFTRRQGSIGSGINLSFIKEVNVKTGGFEPQYGQATGGVVQLVTKSGTSQYHGELGMYAAPQGAEATYLQTDAVRTNLVGNFLHRANFDVDGEFGGPVPGFKNRLFFFGSFNPAWAQQFVSAPPTAGLASLGTMTLFARTYNYAGKLTFKINDSNQLESSVFGDPTKTNTGEQNYVLNTPNDTAMSKWDYGTRNWVVRYNGTMSPSWLVNGSFTWNHSNFDEIPKYDVSQVTSRIDPAKIFPLMGFGFLENHHTDSYALNVDTSKVFHWAGEHTISLGYRYERPNYTDVKTSSGASFAAPDTNLNGEAYLTCTPGAFDCPLGGPTSYVWSGGLRCAMTNPATGQCMDAAQTAAYNIANPLAPIHICSQCPLGSTTNNPTGSAQDVPMYVLYGRGEFDPSNIPTYGRYHAAYINDSWQMNKFITLSLGMRWEQWRMQGTFSGYTFTDNWAPRVGVAIDPWGDRKTKIYGNFGRYNYQTPLDASIRSLSAERDILNMAFAPDFDNTNHIVFNPNGTVNMIFDSAHLLNQLSTSTGGGIARKPALGVSFTGFAPSTKLMYQDEYVVGADHEFKNGLVLSGRFIYRHLGRTLDDVSGVSPEGYAAGILNQNYFIANPNPRLDLFPNPNEKVLAPNLS
ncbi:MAG TPA: TonB-dependent receptor, partial [Terriglobales bacterium]|nr:TonB-dependent receptor [Terriglobales bacterium]